MSEAHRPSDSPKAMQTVAGLGVNLPGRALLLPGEGLEIASWRKWCGGGEKLPRERAGEMHVQGQGGVSPKRRGVGGRLSRQVDPRRCNVAAWHCLGPPGTAVLSADGRQMPAAGSALRNPGARDRVCTVPSLLLVTLQVQPKPIPFLFSLDLW